MCSHRQDAQAGRQGVASDKRERHDPQGTKHVPERGIHDV